MTKKTLALLKSKRREAKEETNAKAAFTLDQLCEISRKLPSNNKGIRDRAIVLTGVALASRRSELTSFDLADVAVDSKQRYSLYVKKSKKDQEFRGRFIGMFPDEDPDLCPERALRAWLRVRGDWAGPLFSRLTGHFNVTKDRMEMNLVNKIVQQCAKLIGLPPKKYGSHSLRITCITTAFDSGVEESQIMKVTGHTTSQMVQRYHRREDPHAYNIHARRGVLARVG